MADLAAAAGAGAATVVRLANKLGYDGFVGLQAAVQRDLSGQLRPAAERIREHRDGPLDDVGCHLSSKLTNVQVTLDALEADADRRRTSAWRTDGRSVLVLSGDASRGVATQFVGDLGALRADVGLIDGNRRALFAGSIATRPTDRARSTFADTTGGCVDAARDAGAPGCGRWPSPTACCRRWRTSLTTPSSSAASAGPFDSHVGTLALLDVVVVAVAAFDRERATDRLDRLESAWRSIDALADE